MIEYVGIRSLSYQLPEETTQEELLALMRELNGREDVNGILVQLPLPDHIDQDLVLTAIAPEKDVDGFHPVALLVISFKFFVLEWHTVTVPFSLSSSMAMGLPTILLLPSTTHSFPSISIPDRFSSWEFTWEFI